ncbi:hypothetical protein EW146_g10386, partial [Bondarzewia mesenterica]
KSTALYNRRHAKILTTLTSLFTSSYVLHWHDYFPPELRLRHPPSFDGRIVLYPSAREVKDYFAWRQADSEVFRLPLSRLPSIEPEHETKFFPFRTVVAHINNLYNTAFWALVQQGGQSTKQAHETLRGTVSSQKHEMLFSRFGINYNVLPERFRKGSVFVREEIQDEEPSAVTGTSDPLDNPSSMVETGSRESAAIEPEAPAPSPRDEQSEHDLISDEHARDKGSKKVQKRLKKSKKEKKGKNGEKGARTRVVLMHCDIIGDAFWNERAYLLEA